MPNNDHGDPRNIVVKDIIAASQTPQAGGISPNRAMKNAQRTWQILLERANKLSTKNQK